MSEVELYYIDTSALLPYYREESMSQQVENLLSSLRPPLLISNLTKVEFTSAVARWVRMGELSDIHANLLENTFNKDLNSGLFMCYQITPSHFSQAEKWLSSRKTSLRTLDALHLACCWDYTDKLITCDTIMHRSATIFGIESIFFE